MSLIKWEPFGRLDNFFDDRLWESFSRRGWDLAIDVYEEGGNIVAKASLPDVKIEDIDISFEENMLSIKGKREEEKEVDKKNYYSKEISRGSFERTVRLPKSVIAKNAEAVFENGILTITAPVVPEEESKTVKVQVKK